MPPASAVLADTSIDKTVQPVELPNTVTPINYRLWFRPNPALSSFDGRADVQIKVQKAVNAITIAGHRIKFTNGTITLQPGNIALIATPQDDGDFYQLRPVSGQIAAGNYSLHMEWTGIINFKSYDDPATKTGGNCGNDPYPGCSAAEGVFRVDLKATDGTTSGAILTQGESNLARQWFPGWDEPVFHPTYEVSAEVPQNWKVVSNAAEKPAVNVDSGYKLVSFEKTPPMPSYLLFFGGGQFDILEDDFTSPLPDGKGLHLRIFTPPGMRDWARPAMQQTKQALDYYYRYTGIPLPLTKFDTVAANDAFKEQKDLNFGGMENWGAILEFADDILPAPGTSMSDYGVTVLTHEAAHQCQRLCRGLAGCRRRRLDPDAGVSGGARARRRRHAGGAHDRPAGRRRTSVARAHAGQRRDGAAAANGPPVCARRLVPRPARTRLPRQPDALRLASGSRHPGGARRSQSETPRDRARARLACGSHAALYASRRRGRKKRHDSQPGLPGQSSAGDGRLDRRAAGVARARADRRTQHRILRIP
ncbi:MAG: Puromycin-sensitive aminopeptidase (EC [uncultured Paraburkholderia sp.]|nr:MAG: Puromycin-sensitive aminopeptidase (EC [uncultured Paraburkholderia sp.]